MVDTRDTPLKAVRINAICPHCREGDLIATNGPVRMTQPLQHLHRCNVCSREHWIADVTYPYIDFKELN